MKKALKQIFSQYQIFIYQNSIRPLINQKEKKIKQREMAERSNFFAGFIKKNDLCFDIGANVGNRTEVFLNLGACVVAVDALPSCCKYLKFKFGNKINIENVGISDKEGEMDLHVGDSTTISTFSKEWIDSLGKERFKGYEWKNTVKVKVITLDQLIEKYGIPAFIKIDVEGYEPQVINGLSHTIPMISFEYAVPEVLQNIEDCLAKLNTTSNGRYAYNYIIGENHSWALPQWLNYSEMITHINSEQFIQTGFGDIFVKFK